MGFLPGLWGLRHCAKSFRLEKGPDTLLLPICWPRSQLIGEEQLESPHSLGCPVNKLRVREGAWSEEDGGGPREAWDLWNWEPGRGRKGWLDVRIIKRL